MRWVVGGGGLKGPGEDARVEGFCCWGGAGGGQGFGLLVGEWEGKAKGRGGAKGEGKGTYLFRRPGRESRARRASRGAGECTIEPWGRRGIDGATGVAMRSRCVRGETVIEWLSEAFSRRTSTAVQYGDDDAGG